MSELSFKVIAGESIQPKNFSFNESNLSKAKKYFKNVSIEF